jgi:hypothetical protein
VGNLSRRAGLQVDTFGGLALTGWTPTARQGEMTT